MWNSIGSTEYMKPANTRLKNAARLLRRRGLSYREIGAKLHIAKSTAKFWCGDVPLSAEHRKRLYTKQIAILSRGPNSVHERRQREIREIVCAAKREIELPIHSQAYKLFGAALYWAEGAKTNNFAITNSDPHLIAFMVQWFSDVLDVVPQRLTAHLNIYPQQNDVELKRFWSDATGIPLENFGKTFVKPLNKKFKKNTLYYGTIKVGVRKGTDMRHRVFGWTEAVMASIHGDIQGVERKWHKLRTDYTRP